uniref:Uncharacterized protein n=1 Tax=Plectus sambesii TaxID=2011161 RepID=A0A914VCE5_9BILA
MKVDDTRSSEWVEVDGQELANPPVLGRALAAIVWREVREVRWRLFAGVAPLFDCLPCTPFGQRIAGRWHLFAFIRLSLTTRRLPIDFG